MKRATREISSAESPKVFWELGLLRTLPMMQAQKERIGESGPLRDDLRIIERRD